MRMRQEELAEKLGITRNYLSQIENRKKEPSKRLVRALQEIARQAPFDSDGSSNGAREVPLLSWARAGAINSYEEIPEEWQLKVATNCPDENAFGLILEGDSMEDYYRQGDIVVAMPAQRPRSHGLVVARLKDRGVRFKILTIRAEQSRPFHLSSYKAHSYPAEDWREEDFDWIYPVYEMRRQVWR